MRIRTWLFSAFLIVPIVEIVLFLYAGSFIGVWPTVGLVVVSALIGSWLVAQQGRQAWVSIRGEIAHGRPPTVQVVHGAMILVAGALLLTPGFLTDAVGFSLLFPRFREILRVWFVAKLTSRWVVTR